MKKFLNSLMIALLLSGFILLPAFAAPIKTSTTSSALLSSSQTGPNQINVAVSAKRVGRLSRSRPISLPLTDQEEIAMPSDAGAKGDKDPGLDFEILGGYLGGKLGYGGAICANHLLGFKNLSSRLNFVYSSDTKDPNLVNRTDQVVGLDLIIKSNTGFLRSRVYIGAGVNYVYRNRNETEGDYGWQAFVGVEGKIFFGSLFLEVGSAMIRPRAGADRDGANGLAGYKIGF